MVKINVMVVTYNQHDVIGRCLESILIQKDYGLNKIIVLDDKSTDSNWDVIMDYQRKYPEFIIPIRNEINKGVYGNFQKAIFQRGVADLYIEIAGDDCLCDGWFMKVQETIQSMNVDLSKSFLVISNWSAVSTDDNTRIYQQKIKKNDDLFSLKTRNRIYNRSILKSSKLIEKYSSIDLTQGVCWAELQYDYYPMLYAENAYYCDYVGTKYYQGIGVSTKMLSKKYLEQRRDAYVQALKKYDYRFIDKCLVKFNINKYSYKLNKSMISLCTCALYYILSCTWLSFFTKH